MRLSWALVPAATIVGASFSWSGSAGAFCRTTTCDATGDQTGCNVQNGCSTSGLPLYWPERCLSFGVQEDGSKRRNITWEQADSIIRAAFQQWLGAACTGGQHPSFEMFDLDETNGPIVCAKPEFNKSAPNANVFMFRDDKWPYPANVNSTLALTTITFEVPTGKILDADVEINSYAIDLTTDGHGGSDLQSIITHESGHFLGLAHSLVPQATMNAAYSPGDTSFRSLSADDQAGICAVYPANRDAPACTQPSPRHGFSRFCGNDASSDSSGTNKGCSVGFRGGSDGELALATLLGLGCLSARRRRRAPNR